VADVARTSRRRVRRGRLAAATCSASQWHLHAVHVIRSRFSCSCTRHNGTSHCVRARSPKLSESETTSFYGICRRARTELVRRLTSTRSDFIIVQNITGVESTLSDYCLHEVMRVYVGWHFTVWHNQYVMLVLGWLFLSAPFVISVLIYPYEPCDVEPCDVVCCRISFARRGWSPAGCL